MTGYPWHARQAGLGREQPLVVPPAIRDADQVPAIVVGPAVVSAAEDSRIAALLDADDGPLMPAAIEQDVELAISGIAGHDDWLQAEVRSLEIAASTQLALVSRVQPRPPEQTLQLAAKQRGVGVGQWRK